MAKGMWRRASTLLALLFAARNASVAGALRGLGVPASHFARCSTTTTTMTMTTRAPCAASATVPLARRRWRASRGGSGRSLRRERLANDNFAGGATTRRSAARDDDGSSGSSGSSSDSGGGFVSVPQSQQKRSISPMSFLVRYRTPLLFACLVLQKVLADTLTGYTRSRTTYSGATVSMLSEVLKFPVLFAAIAVFGGQGVKRVPSTLRGAATQQPFALAWIAAAYAAQNVLYFAALSRISAASYQVLSQSKLIFTAMLTVTILGRMLTRRQVVSLATLLIGSLLVQLSEMAGAATGGFFVSAGKFDALYGGLLTVLGALLASLPNVWYEKLLKTEGEDEWVRNVQVTCWIFLWIAASQLFASTRTHGVGVPGQQQPFWASPAAFVSALLGGSGLDGITPLVWVVIGLKALNGILIPATLKYAGNLIYLYAKPTSIVATALLGAAYTATAPSPVFALGAALVVGSMIAYSEKKTASSPAPAPASSSSSSSSSSS